MFSEDLRLEGLIAGARVKVAVGQQPRLPAEVLQHLLPAPSLFGRHLGKKDSPSAQGSEDDTIPSGKKRFQTPDRLGHGEDGDLDGAVLQFLLLERRETPVLEGALLGKQGDKVAQRVPRPDQVADAATEPAMLMEGHESSRADDRQRLVHSGDP